MRGNLIGVSLPPHFSFLDGTTSWGMFGGRQDDEHLAKGRSVSSKMPRAPSLRDTETRMKLEASVPSEGEEFGQAAGTPLQ